MVSWETCVLWFKKILIIMIAFAFKSILMFFMKEIGDIMKIHITRNQYLFYVDF